ncbi:MAG: hypothetical protein AAGH99_04895 [Planctomycetota bacterium]
MLVYTIGVADFWDFLLRSLTVIALFVSAYISKKVLEDRRRRSAESDTWNMKNKALGYSKLFHPEFAKTKAKIESILKTAERDPEKAHLLTRSYFPIPMEEINDAIKNEKLSQSDFTSFLAYYENIAIGVKNGVVSEDVILDLMGLTYYKTYCLMRGYISQSRKRNPRLWSNMASLAERLRQKMNIRSNLVLIISDDAVSAKSSVGNNPFDNVTYRDSYLSLVQQCGEKDISVYISSPSDINIGESQWAGWGFDGKGWYVTDLPKPMLVFDKFQSRTGEDRSLKKSLERVVPVLNATRLSDLLQDKFESYEKFKKHMIPTVDLHRNSQPSDNDIGYLDSLISHSDFVEGSERQYVVKPKNGFKGRGVCIVEGTTSPKSLMDEDFVLQPFLETGGGIQGINAVLGRHDLRVLLLNGDPVMAYARMPSESDFVSNGGEVVYLDLDEIPSKVISICKKIDSELKSDSEYRFYSIDFGFGPSGRPWVFELNAKPGLVWNSDDQEDRKNTIKLHSLIADLFRAQLVNC